MTPSELCSQGDVARNVILGVLLVKSIIWAVSLGSGTSGGVLAPLLMMGGALGGIEAMFLPHEGAGFWPLISMGAISGRHHALAFDRHHLRAGTHARHQRAAAAAGGQCDRARFSRCWCSSDRF